MKNLQDNAHITVRNQTYRRIQMKQTSVFLTLIDGDTHLMQDILFEDIHTSTSSLILLKKPKNIIMKNIHMRNITSK